jgi:hypothetical protein
VTEPQHEPRGIPLDAGPESTLLSWNGTTPESPDRTRLVYLKLTGPVGERTRTVPGELWVCDFDLMGHRKVFDVPMTCAGFPHNGAMASWIDDRRVVFRQLAPSGPKIYVLDVDSGEVCVPPIVGNLGHYAAHGKVPFGIYPAEVGRNPAYPSIDGEGLYQLDTDAGTVERVIATEAIIAFAREQGFTPTEKTHRLAHEMLNPAATKMMIRLNLEECLTLFAIDLGSGEKTLFPYKPLHQLWYDDETYVGVAGASSDPGDKREIARWQPDGTRLETLVSSDDGSGIGNHIDISPDRRWFVTDSIYHSDPVTVDLYRRGRGNPVATLDRHSLTRPVWGLRAHANPVFSWDGRRVYFVQAFGEMRVRAVVVDLSSYRD